MVESSTEIRTDAPLHCERCHQEHTHFVQVIGPHNEPHRVCWECINRAEKRINLRPSWRRMRQAKQ